VYPYYGAVFFLMLSPGDRGQREPHVHEKCIEASIVESVQVF
jgi:hypothetical protein